MSAAMSVEDLDQTAEVIEQFTEAPRQVKISLAADAPKAIPLFWNAGGKQGRDTNIMLQPGKSVVQPLWKAEVWFGPFTLPERYAAARDESARAELKQFWQTEKTRLLNKYDYPRPENHVKDGFQPIGPHRLPDITVTVLEADGTPNEPISLHELYKVGKFDSKTFELNMGPSVEDVKADYERQLADVEASRTADRERIAKLEGMVAAVLAGQKKAS